MWPFSKRPRKLEPIAQPSIEFLGEQDGPPERTLKAELTALFTTRARVSRAYLCRVRYRDGAHAVALAVASPEDTRLVAEAGAVFRKMFGPHTFLDIMFLDGGKESRLASVCRPFYSVSPAERDAEKEAAKLASKKEGP